MPGSRAVLRTLPATCNAAVILRFTVYSPVQTSRLTLSPEVLVPVFPVMPLLRKRTLILDFSYLINRPLVDYFDETEKALKDVGVVFRLEGFHWRSVTYFVLLVMTRELILLGFSK